nr:udp-glycosyltransferase 72b1 [Quercus suber]
MEQKPHIAILPSLGMGQLTFGSPSKAMKEVLESLPTSIDHVFLPPVSLDNLEGVKPRSRIILTMKTFTPISS